MRLTALALAGSCALALTACGGSDDGISLERLPRLVLQPADLPAFVRFDEGSQAPRDVVPGPRSDPSRFGHEGGWKARFRRPGSAATKGPLVVESRADLFGGSGGARKDLTAYEEQFRAQSGSGAGARLLDAPSLGDGATAVTFRQGAGTTAVRFFAVGWRRGSVTASVTVEGFEGKVALREALSLARKQDRRIARAA